jgi:hypothetical protein
MTTQTYLNENGEKLDFGSNSNTLEWWNKTHQDAMTLARWISLYEAVNIIADKAEEKNIDFENLIKPLAVLKYMESTEHIIYKKILEEDYKIKVCYSEDTEEDFTSKEMEIV